MSRTCAHEGRSRPRPTSATRPQVAACHAVVAVATVNRHRVLVAVPCRMSYNNSNSRRDGPTPDSCKYHVDCK